MAGGTHAFDMIKRLRENENLRKKGYFKTKDTYTKHSASLNIDYKTATPEQLLEIRKKVREERKRETRRSVIVLVISILGTGVLIFLVLRWEVSNK